MLCHKQKLQEPLENIVLQVLPLVGIPWWQGGQSIRIVGNPSAFFSRYFMVTSVSPLSLYVSPEWGSEDEISLQPQP